MATDRTATDWTATDRIATDSLVSLMLLHRQRHHRLVALLCGPTRVVKKHRRKPRVTYDSANKFSLDDSSPAAAWVAKRCQGETERLFFWVGANCNLILLQIPTFVILEHKQILRQPTFVSVSPQYSVAQKLEKPPYQCAKYELW